MKHTTLILLAVILCIPLVGCDDTNDDDTPRSIITASTVKQIDMQVVIHIHPTTFKYFDYIVRYMDNQGYEYADTISQGDIEVKEWRNYDASAKSRATSSPINLYAKTFIYTTLPISCECRVELIPKVADDTEMTFTFINPKPYIFEQIYFSETPNPEAEEYDNRDMEGITEIHISEMPLNTFFDVYGKYFFSYCQVSYNNESINVISH